MDIRALTSLRSRIARLLVLARTQSAAGFEQSHLLDDGSTHTYSISGLKSPEQLEDELLSLYVWVWSLKDHLKEAFRAKGWRAQDVEDVAKGSTHLLLVSDIANRAKHGQLRESRSGKWAELADVGWTVPQSSLSKISFGAFSVGIDVEKPEEVQLRAVVRLSDGVQLDAFAVLEEAVVDWERHALSRLAAV
jgi:hypothetical protein